MDSGENEGVTHFKNENKGLYTQNMAGLPEGSFFNGFSRLRKN
jgi:hypothetical protein